MRFLAILLAGATAAGASERCDPPPELAEFARTLPADGRAKRAAIEARLTQSPGDFTLNRLFVDSSVYERKKIRNRYQRMLEMHPNSLDHRYLQARSLVGSDTREALRQYQQILEQDPDYPWVHLSQLEIYRAEAFRDRTKLAFSFSAITRVCPALFQPYRYLSEIPDADLASLAAKKLRGKLKDSADPRELIFFSNLWAAEFRVRPIAEKDDERRQVAEDLKRLTPFTKDPAIGRVVENGAKLTGDEALVQRMESERTPDAGQLVLKASNQWFQKHPRPKDGDPPEKRHAYGRELQAKSQEWLSMAPDNIIALHDRVMARIFLDAPSEEIARAGDDLMDLIRRDDSGLSASWINSLARAYVDAGVLPDRVPALIAEAIRRFDDPEAVIEIDLAPSPDITISNRAMMISDHVVALTILAKCYGKRQEIPKAHAALQQAEDFMASHPLPADDKGPGIRHHRINMQRDFWQAKAELAELEGRKLDAVTWYGRSRSFWPVPYPGVLERERKLWKELGGSDEGWQQWITPVADSPQKTAPPASRTLGGPAANRKLPALFARDTQGNLWTLDRLAGKTTVAVVWATWCEPCRAELPYFAELADRIKGRADLLAISLNTDDNPALAESFAKSHAYTFPILSAKQYAEDLMPSFSIPRTWIIKNGIIAEELTGFGGGKWVDDAMARLK